MLEVFTFFTDTFQAPVLCHVTNVLAELLVQKYTGRLMLYYPGNFWLHAFVELLLLSTICKYIPVYK